MSRQAENFEMLCKGNSLRTIAMALNNVSASVKNELMEKYGAKSVDELAMKMC